MHELLLRNTDAKYRSNAVYFNINYANNRF